MTREIKDADWPAFCQQLTEQRVGAMVKLETIGSDGIKTAQVANAPLESMVFDQTGACNNVITLRLRDNHESVHEIREPLQVTLHPSGTPGDFNPLRIAAENGIFIITLHPAIHTQLLDKLQTG
jgi:hypothetical protein